MKNLLLFTILCLSFLSCSDKQEVLTSEFDSPNVYVSMNDELNNRVFISDSTLNARDLEFSAYKDSVRNIVRPSQTINCDSLNDALFEAKYKLEKVGYYLKICLKNPTQDKFLKGWIRRALN